jgi:hypothetical protein
MHVGASSSTAHSAYVIVIVLMVTGPLIYLGFKIAVDRRQVAVRPDGYIRAARVKLLPGESCLFAAAGSQLIRRLKSGGYVVVTSTRLIQRPGMLANLFAFRYLDIPVASVTGAGIISSGWGAVRKYGLAVSIRPAVEARTDEATYAFAVRDAEGLISALRAVSDIPD